MTAVSILHFISLYILMIDRKVIAFLKRDSVKTACKSEHRVNAALKLEIRLEFLCAGSPL